MNKVELGSPREQRERPILATEEGIAALRKATIDAHENLAKKTLEMGIVASDGDKDYHENFQLRDLQLEVEGPLLRRVIELEALLQRTMIGKGIGNFYRLFTAKIETPGDDPETQTIRLVGSVEVNHIGHTGPDGEMYISYESPLGKVLLQAELLPGSVYIFEAPIGRGKVTILEVKDDPEGLKK